MCYEERFFLRRATKQSRTSEEPKSVVERPPPSAQQDRPKPETTKPTEVERELETV
jgi:hypothetical protein